MVTYEQAHQRIRRLRGAASTHPCINCGDRAAHWSYRNVSDTELEGSVRGRSGTLRFSPDPADYDPMCVVCHRIRDRQVAADVWDWRNYTQTEVEVELVEDLRAELEDLREVCAEDDLDYEEEARQLTEDYIAKARQISQFVHRYRLMFGSG